MRECSSGKEVLRAAAPRRLGAVGVVVIERFMLYAKHGGAGAWMWASNEPYAVVVRDGDGFRVLGIAEAEVSLDALRDRVPALDGVLMTL